jgi:hypothetical protein
MNETERYIVAAAFAACDQPWETFAERMKLALGKLDEADQEADAQAKAKRLSIWETLGR